MCELVSGRPAEGDVSPLLTARQLNSSPDSVDLGLFKALLNWTKDTVCLCVSQSVLLVSLVTDQTDLCVLRKKIRM